MLSAAYLKSLGVESRGRLAEADGGICRIPGVLSCLAYCSMLERVAAGLSRRFDWHCFYVSRRLWARVSTTDCFRRGSAKPGQVVASETGDLQLGSRAVLRAVACGVGLIGRSVYSDDTSLEGAIRVVGSATSFTSVKLPLQYI